MNEQWAETEAKRALARAGFAIFDELIVRHFATALRAERERCAKVADAWAADGDWDPDCCRGIATQIRDPESAEPQL